MKPEVVIPRRRPPIVLCVALCGVLHVWAQYCAGHPRTRVDAVLEMFPVPYDSERAEASDRVRTRAQRPQRRSH